MGNVLKRARISITRPRNHHEALGAGVPSRSAIDEAHEPDVRPDELADELRGAERETPATHEHLQVMFGSIPIQISLRARR